MNRTDILKWLRKNYGDNCNDIILADGFESAFVGVGQQFNNYMAVYDYGKCVESCIKDGMSYSEAEEYIEFNVTGAYIGTNTPVFLTTIDREGITMAKPVPGDPRVDNHMSDLMDNMVEFGKKLNSITDNMLKNTSGKVLIRLRRAIAGNGAKMLKLSKGVDKWMQVRVKQGLKVK